MFQLQLKQLSDYIENLEEGLYEWDYNKKTMQTEWSELYEIIKLLMEETYKTADQELKPVLAEMEYRARKCKDCIERRVNMNN